MTPFRGKPREIPPGKSGDREKSTRGGEGRANRPNRGNASNEPVVLCRLPRSNERATTSRVEGQRERKVALAVFFSRRGNRDVSTNFHA